MRKFLLHCLINADAGGVAPRRMAQWIAYEQDGTMTASLIAPMAQVCVFALGCTVIHAAKAHAAAVTHVLTGVTAIAAALVLIGATVIYAPDEQARFDEVTVYVALSLQPATFEAVGADTP